MPKILKKIDSAKYYKIYFEESNTVVSSRKNDAWMKRAYIIIGEIFVCYMFWQVPKNTITKNSKKY